MYLLWLHEMFIIHCLHVICCHGNMFVQVTQTEVSMEIISLNAAHEILSIRHIISIEMFRVGILESIQYVWEKKYKRL